MDLKGVEMTWLGHAAVRFRSGDTVVYVDPWLTGNPACPPDYHEPDRVDAVYLTHGHFDHFGDTEALARQFGPQIFCIHEIAVYLEGRDVTNVVGCNKGGTIAGPGGVVGSMVDAVHSSGISGDDGIVDGGDPGGWVLGFPGGLRVYHAGDTALFGDMALIGELYRPQVGLLPIGGHFTMDPPAAARAARLLGLETVVPIHYGTFPILTGTPEQLEAELRGTGIEVVAPSAGEAMT